MSAYYNEIDPFAAQWLRELIKENLIAPGEVDERSIEDVAPNDLHGFTQCHFFAGIGGWSHALRLAGIADDFPVWTGSCPCQPFSAAGKGEGFADERHLWPTWHWLIKQCRPAIVFGEQVASKAANMWFDLVQADLEAMGYAFGVVPFPAASLGAPHIRDRAYWVANSETSEWRGSGRKTDNWGRAEEIGRSGSFGRLADAYEPGLQPWKRNDKTERYWHTVAAKSFDDMPGTTSPTNGFWRDADWLYCRDGKWRPVEPGSSPLANGVSNRVGKLRGYGNAIVTWQAAEFIKTFFDYDPELESL